MQKNEIFAFLGPNGAGKTTTIKMLNGLLRPDKGDIYINGFHTAREAMKAKSFLGYVPDEPYLYDKLTGREFLYFVGSLYRIEKELIHQKIEELNALFELNAFLDELTETYSHGMKQRIVMSAALLHDPKILILDEPMVGLDPKNMKRVKKIIQEFASQEKCVFMSTHSLSVAEECATQICILDQGKIRAKGTLAELKSSLTQHPDHTLEDLFLKITAEEEFSDAS
ncbi:MAG: ABC transporter ATP-binding protein [Planctomycetota bacterium]